MNDLKIITTASLINIYEIFQQLVSKCALYLRDNTDLEATEYIEQTKKLENAKLSLAAIDSELKSRQQQLQLSEEELYFLAGQKDAYISIHFFPGSDAYKKYGESAHGTVWYHKKERERLEALTVSANYGRTNGITYLSSGTSDTKLQEQLQYEGFETKDIFEVYMGDPSTKVKSYGQPGTKQIPDTQIIKINSKTFNVIAAQQYVLGHYLQDGYKLPPHDLTLYYANLYLFQKDKISQSEIDKYLMKADGTGFNELADYIIHDIKAREKTATENELNHLKQLLMQRRDMRIAYVKQHFGVSEKQLTALRQVNFQRYMRVEETAWMFETETLHYLAPDVVVYLDYERFMHIFQRHNPDYFIPGSTKS